MKPFEWDPNKNLWLRKQRGLGFKDVAAAILAGKLLDTINHPNRKKYPGQKMFIVLIQDYCYTIPYVENEKNIFLKTFYPSRKATKKYLTKKGSNL